MSDKKILIACEESQVICTAFRDVSCGTSRYKGNKDKIGFPRAGGAAKIRSRTFLGIALAMATQWGDFLNEQ